MAHELAAALQQTGRIRKRRPVKESHVYMRSEHIDIAEGASPGHATGQPSCRVSRTSSPHLRITSNHSCAMAPNSPRCSFIHASMAGSRSTVPLNRSNSVFIVEPLLFNGAMSILAVQPGLPAPEAEVQLLRRERTQLSRLFPPGEELRRGPSAHDTNCTSA